MDLESKLYQAIGRILKIEKQLARTRRNMGKIRLVCGIREVKLSLDRELQIRCLEKASQRALKILYEVNREALKAATVYKS
jgi:hypothetical protein